jgi:hypothetical protein
MNKPCWFCSKHNVAINHAVCATLPHYLHEMKEEATLHAFRTGPSKATISNHQNNDNQSDPGKMLNAVRSPGAP